MNNAKRPAGRPFSKDKATRMATIKMTPSQHTDFLERGGSRWVKRQLADPVAIGSELAALAQEEALSLLIESDWYRSAPAQFRQTEPVIKFTGIEHHPVFASIGGLSAGSRSAPFLCGKTQVGGIVASVRLRLEFGGGGLVIDELGNAAKA